MSCLGVRFAISEEEAKELMTIKNEKDRLSHLQEVIEERYFKETPDLKAESDKAWDVMHRVLTDGSLSWDVGSYPLNHTVLGGELLYTDSDYIMSLKSPSQVRDIAAALATVTEGDFRKQYFDIDTDSYGFPLSEDDYQYTWGWFQGIRNLFAKAADGGRYVLFTADQ